MVIEEPFLKLPNTLISTQVVLRKVSEQQSHRQPIYRFDIPCIDVDLRDLEENVNLDNMLFGCVDMAQEPRPKYSKAKSHRDGEKWFLDGIYLRDWLEELLSTTLPMKICTKDCRVVVL